jgi:hypothetical protein
MVEVLNFINNGISDPLDRIISAVMFFMILDAVFILISKLINMGRK